MEHIFLIIAKFAVLASISLAFISCGKSIETSQEKQSIPVITEIAQPQTMRLYIELNGGIEAKNSVKVYPLISGKVAGTQVDLGTYVNRGDVLLLVDPSTPGSQYQMSQVTAPISGNVITIPPRAGTRVTTSTEVTVIGDLSQLQVRTYVPERYFSLIYPNLIAEVRVESSPDEKFFATVKHVSPVVDQSSRTVEVIISFNERNPKITAGMYAKIKLYLQEYENTISVPENAVLMRSGKTCVMTAKNGTARLITVKTGITVDSRTQITAGLEAGDSVITEGLTSIQDGSDISVIQ